MGLADDFTKALAESVVDLPRARAVLLEGKDDPEYGLSDALGFALRRQKVLEDAVLRLAREIDERAEEKDH